jgi:hypothetical protein
MTWGSLVPDWLVLLLYVLVPAGLAAGVHAIVRRVLPASSLLPHHDVAGFLVAIVGVLYAVVLGFLVVTVWSAFDSAQRTSDIEAGSVGDAFGFAQMLPEPRRTDKRKRLAAYAIVVRDREWVAMRTGRQDPQARALLVAALRALGEPVPHESANLDEALNRMTTRDAVLASLRSVADNRRLRLIEANAKLPTALYLALLLGATIVLCFVFLFGVENQLLQLTMTGLVAGCIGLLFGVIVVFSAPYSGAIHVSPDAWTYVIDNNHFAETAGKQSP